ncbi:MAG: thioredoxin fold domain-containing protein, partial [Bacteroidota bacterium]
MKIGNNLLFFSLFLFCISELPAKKWSADLPTGSLETLQEQAASSQQPYLVYLYRKGDRDCKRMNKKTWPDPTLKQYLGQHYLVQQQEAMGMQMEWVSKYHLYDWPAILIFHPEGRLMGRIDGYVAPQTLVVLAPHFQARASRVPGYLAHTSSTRRPNR